MKTKKGEFVYVKYSRKPPYLPLAVADTPKEMASIAGTTSATVRSDISHHHGTFMKVRIDNESN